MKEDDETKGNVRADQRGGRVTTIPVEVCLTSGPAGGFDVPRGIV